MKKLFIITILIFIIYFIDINQSLAFNFVDFAIYNSQSAKGELSAIIVKQNFETITYYYDINGFLQQITITDKDGNLKEKNIFTINSSELKSDGCAYDSKNNPTIKYKIKYNSLKKRTDELTSNINGVTIKKKIIKYDPSGRFLTNITEFNSKMNIIEKIEFKKDDFYYSSLILSGDDLNVKQKWVFNHKGDSSEISIIDYTGKKEKKYILSNDQNKNIKTIYELNNNDFKKIIEFEYQRRAGAKSLRVTEFEVKKKIEYKNVKTSNTPAQEVSSQIQTAEVKKSNDGTILPSSIMDAYLKFNSNQPKKINPIVQHFNFLNSLLSSGINDDRLAEVCEYYKNISQKTLSESELNKYKQYDNYYNTLKAVCKTENLNDDEFKKFIKTNKININRADRSSGKTMLMYSVIRNQKELTEILINNGADLSIKDLEGKDVFEYINEQKTTPEIIKILNERKN